MHGIGCVHAACIFGSGTEQHDFAYPLMQVQGGRGGGLYVAPVKVIMEGLSLSKINSQLSLDNSVDCTTPSYSTIRDHKGVGMAHEITPPKTSLYFPR